MELVRWLIFEPNLLEKFSRTLSRKASVIWFLKTFPWIILLTVTLYFFFSAIIVALDLPIRFPGEFKSGIVEKWHPEEFFPNFLLWIQKTYIYMAFVLALILAGGIVLSLTLGLPFVLTGSLVVALTFTLLEGLSENFTFGGLVTVFFKVGFAVGLAGFFKLDLIMGVAAGLGIGLGEGLVFGSKENWELGFKVGLASGLASVLGFCSGYFRIPFYPFYVIKNFIWNSLTLNPFLKDATIRLPIPFLKQKLLKFSWNNSQLSFQFRDFLLEHRPLQKTLAFHITHTATAATWYHHPLHAEFLILPLLDEEDTESKLYFQRAKWINKLETLKSQRILAKYRPSANWFRQLETLKSQLIQAEKQNHKGLKKDAWQSFHASLKKFEEITLTQSDIWKADYLKAIRKWQEESEKQMKQMEEELKYLESVTRNIYRVGEALRPNEYGQQTFVGREDLRDEFSFRILSSGIMPTFLLQGQRRVGKTSLVNFLPELLGPRFLILSQDMQSDEFQVVGLHILTKN
ncbi:MAG: hypothetical protein AB7S75_16955 [Desulfococcaceae bacterium]